MASTPNHALDGCRAKLDRAEQHLNALSDEIRATMEGEGDPGSCELFREAIGDVRAIVSSFDSAF